MKRLQNSLNKLFSKFRIMRYAHFNLGNTMKFINKDVYKREVRKAYELNPNYDIALIEAGRIE